MYESISAFSAFVKKEFAFIRAFQPEALTLAQCSDKDCLEDLQVFFTPLNQAIVDNATAIKCKSVQVYTVLMDVNT